MDPWIHEAKTRMVELTREVQRQHPIANILTAFVGYRDYDDAEPMIVLPFQTPQAIMEQIQDIQAEGGNDIAEDVATALERALHQDWLDADVKIVFHIADAPAHGLNFHAPHVSDRFPSGDPNGLDPRDFVERMSFLNIHFTFVRIHASTDMMIEEFYNCYTKGGSFKVIDLQHQHRFGLEVTRSISDSITLHCTASRVL
jgi:hypothetical protein